MHVLHRAFVWQSSERSMLHVEAMDRMDDSLLSFYSSLKVGVKAIGTIRWFFRTK